MNLNMWMNKFLLRTKLNRKIYHEGVSIFYFLLIIQNCYGSCFIQNTLIKKCFLSWKIDRLACLFVAPPCNFVSLSKFVTSFLVYCLHITKFYVYLLVKLSINITTKNIHIAFIDNQCGQRCWIEWKHEIIPKTKILWQIWQMVTVSIFKAITILNQWSEPLTIIKIPSKRTFDVLNGFLFVYVCIYIYICWWQQAF